jgi:hypothetical protein
MLVCDRSLQIPQGDRLERRQFMQQVQGSRIERIQLANWVLTMSAYPNKWSMMSDCRQIDLSDMNLDLTSYEFAVLLERCDLNFAEAGRICGVDPSTARGWARSRKPRRYAVAIIKLMATRKLDVLMYRALKATHDDTLQVDQLVSLVESNTP